MSGERLPASAGHRISASAALTEVSALRSSLPENSIGALLQERISPVHLLSFSSRLRDLRASRACRSAEHKRQAADVGILDLLHDLFRVGKKEAVAGTAEILADKLLQDQGADLFNEIFRRHS